MTYEWEDSDGVQHVTAWSKAVRNAMLRGGAEYQRQRVLDRVSAHWPVIQMDVCDCGGERHFPPPSPGTSNLQPVLRHAGVVSVKIG